MQLRHFLIEPFPKAGAICNRNGLGDFDGFVFNIWFPHSQQKVTQSFMLLVLFLEIIQRRLHFLLLFLGYLLQIFLAAYNMWCYEYKQGE